MERATDVVDAVTWPKLDEEPSRDVEVDGCEVEFEFVVDMALVVGVVEVDADEVEDEVAAPFDTGSITGEDVVMPEALLVANVRTETLVVDVMSMVELVSCEMVVAEMPISVVLLLVLRPDNDTV